MRRAQQTVIRAIRRGELTRSNTCEECEKEKYTIAHHEDYDKPLDVNWLCISCHRLLGSD